MRSIENEDRYDSMRGCVVGCDEVAAAEGESDSDANKAIKWRHQRNNQNENMVMSSTTDNASCNKLTKFKWTSHLAFTNNATTKSTTINCDQQQQQKNRPQKGRKSALITGWPKFRSDLNLTTEVAVTSANLAPTLPPLHFLNPIRPRVNRKKSASVKSLTRDVSPVDIFDKRTKKSTAFFKLKGDKRKQHLDPAARSKSIEYLDLDRPRLVRKHGSISIFNYLKKKLLGLSLGEFFYSFVRKLLIGSTTKHK